MVSLFSGLIYLRIILESPPPYTPGVSFPYFSLSKRTDSRILEAEAQDLVVIGNASNCSWIGQAIADSISAQR